MPASQTIPQRGINWRFYIDTSTSGAATYTLISTQRDASWGQEPVTVDAGNKSNGGNAEIPVSMKWSASLSAQVDFSDTGFRALFDTARDQAFKKFRYGDTSAGFYWDFEAYVSFSESANKDDLNSHDYTFQIVGQPTFTG